jgi:RimJ/RimL family protein N-acetyltransferase
MLRGKRVILRAIERADIERLHELNQQVELVLAGDGHWRPTPLAARERSFEKRLDDPDGSWFVIEADGRVIGDIELHSRDRRSGVAALGVAIYDRDYLGRGYGREAIGLLLGWAFEIQNYRRIWLTTWATNERALRCYRALGFVEEGRQRRHIFVGGEYVDVVAMGLLRDEWRARRQEAAYATR